MGAVAGTALDVSGSRKTFGAQPPAETLQNARPACLSRDARALVDSFPVADWASISALATGAGTLVLAGATFASVRSANRAARVAERSLLANLRPLLIPSRLEDPVQKITYADGKWLQVAGGGGVAEMGDEAVYLALALRNAGQGHRGAARLAPLSRTAQR